MHWRLKLLEVKSLSPTEPCSRDEAFWYALPKGSLQILLPAQTPLAVAYQVRGRSDSPGGEAIHSSRSRTQQKGEVRQDRRPCPASTPGHRNNAGSRETGDTWCQRTHQSAMAHQSLQHHYMSSARARRPGDFKTIKAASRKEGSIGMEEQVTLLLNKVAGGQDTHQQSQSLLPHQ